MRLNVDLAGFLRELATRGGGGLYEKRAYWRLETVPHNEAKVEIFVRGTAVPVGDAGMAFLLEMVESCGLDYNGKAGGSERAVEVIDRIKKACENYGITCLEGRIELS